MSVQRRICCTPVGPGDVYASNLHMIITIHVLVGSDYDIY